MRTFLQSMGVLSLLLAGAGCGHGDMDMMDDHAEELDQHMGAYAAALADHRVAISGAGSLDAMRSEETRHREVGEDHMAGMTHEMDDMMDCMGSPHTSSHADRLSGDLDLMRSEMNAHHDAMLAAGSMDAALDEEARHEIAMAERMFSMADHRDAMMGDVGGMSCP